MPGAQSDNCHIVMACNPLLRHCSSNSMHPSHMPDRVETGLRVQEAMQHLQQLQPAVASLADLEMQAQRSYWNLKKQWGEPQPTAA